LQQRRGQGAESKEETMMGAQAISWGIFSDVRGDMN
jgi:hypothetical protein